MLVRLNLQQVSKHFQQAEKQEPQQIHYRATIYKPRVAELYIRLVVALEFKVCSRRNFSKHKRKSFFFESLSCTETQLQITRWVEKSLHSKQKTLHHQK